eukprot:scaffold67194_cov54-Attheya_sp.AAC.2
MIIGCCGGGILLCCTSGSSYCGCTTVRGVGIKNAQDDDVMSHTIPAVARATGPRLQDSTMACLPRFSRIDAPRLL